MKATKTTRLAAALLAGLMLLGSVGCTGEAGSTDTDPSTGENSRPDTPTATGAPTGAPTDAPTDAPTEPETEPEAPVRTETEMDIYGNGYTNNLIVGFNEQGRVVPAVAGRREDEDKQVGIFYFLWLGQHGSNGIYHIPTIREQYGDDVLFHQNVPESPSPQFHWWETPLYGYYNSGDEWVIRRHMEMLTEAGVDFLVFDTTNANYYSNVAKRVMKVISELRAEGWDAPQVTWYTHSYSVRTAEGIYNTFYKTETYPESWYCVDGKPMIIAYTDGELDEAEARSRGDTSFVGVDMSQEMQDFFYVRTPRWPYDPMMDGGWPYTEWQYPQPMNGGDMVSVSVSSHTAVPYSFSVSRENWPDNWGRGWDVKKKENVEADIMKGTFFDSQWNIAIKRDPRFVMITGWNEWVAQKNLYDGEYAFVDNFDMQYSRDIEPMQGGYEDAYYIQMMARIREYKYTSMEGKIAATVKKTIDVAGPVSQWEDVNAVYRRVGKDDGSRKAYDAAHKDYYEQDAVRNNLCEIRVTVDAENLYFYIKAEEDIDRGSDTDNWMNLFIGTGSLPTAKGWEGYEFVINRSNGADKATIERLNADFTSERLEATATFTIQGNVMQISVPREALGLSEAGDFYFKVADGVTNPADIMDYYVTGRSMPMGRLSYLYQIGNMD